MVRVSGKGSGRVSLAGMVCARPGTRTRLIFRMLVHHGRRAEKKGFKEADFAALLAAGTTDQLAVRTRTRLKKLQYHPDLLDGFITETGLTLTPP